MATTQLRIGVDTGGTFTDIILDPGDGCLINHKLLSTPEDPSQAVIEGINVVLALLAAKATAQIQNTSSPPLVVHGSTVATNALLEGKGAHTAFVTTAGFEDTLFIGRQHRPQLYDLEPVKPVVPLSPETVVGVKERVAYDGTVLTPLETLEIDKALAKLEQLGVESVAISLLHSYANFNHEQQLAAPIQEHFPQVHVTVSHALVPEFREYERAATCLANAVVAPPMIRYLEQLNTAISGSLRVMSSTGGSLPLESIHRAPVQTILSGPAGGVIGALAASKATGIEQIITFDMGGTSTDVSLCDRKINQTTESEIAGLALRLPMLDIHTVGAGGGSVAWVDPGGALRVGPQSMGADPGPACYGRQQDPLQATVTDAHAVLGHLALDQPLGGHLPLNRPAAIDAISSLADKASLAPRKAALGVLRVAETTMARAVQRISVERGHDPRDFTLFTFGGAGGLHAARLAELLGIRRVMVPRDPGLLSALGMLAAAPLHCFSQAVMLRITAADPIRHALPNHPRIANALAQLQHQADEALSRDEIPLSARKYSPTIDLRYQGQSYELTVPLRAAGTVEEFTAQHEKLYGYRADEKDLEITAVRLEARGPAPELRFPALPHRTGPVPGHLLSTSTVFTAGQEQPCWLAQRDDLLAGDELIGPGIISEYSATTLIPQGWQVTVNALGQLLLQPIEANSGGDKHGR